jgi:hypothetical protein
VVQFDLETLSGGASNSAEQSRGRLKSPIGANSLVGSFAPDAVVDDFEQRTQGS